MTRSFRRSPGVRPQARSKFRRPSVEGLEPRSLLSLTGAVDPTFGTAGYASVTFQANYDPGTRISLEAIAVQADGKTVAAGSITSGFVGERSKFIGAVSRLGDDGKPDPTFGTGGVAYPFGNDGSSTGSGVGYVIVQPDGKIVILGSVTTNEGLSNAVTTTDVARLNPDGSLDTTFGVGGIQAFPRTGLVIVPNQALALTHDGKIVLGGRAEATQFSQAMGLVARLNPNGSLDTTFGDGGIARISPNLDNQIGPYSIPPTLAVQADDKLILSSPYSQGDELDRLNLDGSLDTTFGSGGRANPASNLINANFARTDFRYVTPQPDGKLVLLGTATLYTGPASAPMSVVNIQTLLGRINPDGSLDTTFGKTGDVLVGSPEPDVPGNPGTPLPVVVPPGYFGFAGLATIIRPDGKILLTGVSNNNELSLLQVNADGSPDASFGPNGQVVDQATADVQAVNNNLRNSAFLLPDGKVETLSLTKVIRFLGPAVTGDYNNDGKADLAVYLPSQGVFAYRPSGSGPDVVVPFGVAGAGNTLPAPGDYSGTGKTDLAAYLPSQGIYAIRPSGGGPDQIVPFGVAGAGNTIPAPGDYDGSGKTEIAVYIPSQGIFAYRPANGGPDVAIAFFGASPGQVIPAQGNYDGTGKTIPAAYLPASGSFLLKHADGIEQTIPFGVAGAGQSVPEPGDYDGSGKTELAVYIPSQGLLAYRPANGGPDVAIPFGLPGAGQTLPAPGDYSGSGKTEVAAYLPSQGIFAYRPSGGGADVVIRFGVPGPGQTIPFDTINEAIASITPTISASSVDVLPEFASKKARATQVSPSLGG